MSASAHTRSGKTPAAGSVRAIRGAFLSYRDDPFHNDVADCVHYESDGLIVLRDGFVEACGPAAELLTTLPAGAEPVHYNDALILPGFIDCHVHYPQTQIIGAYGKQLMDWLDKYTFVAEQHFKDENHAREVARVFLRESLRCGTTTSAVYCTVDPQSVDAFFEASIAIGARNIAGKVLMDRNAPPDLLDTAESGYQQSRELIERWHGQGRSLYCVTPRFAPTSSPEQMQLAGELWQEHPGTYLQSHVSENTGEVDWARSLFPERDSYVDIYAHYGQLGPRAVYGHGVHLSEAEFQTLHDTGTAIAHCPTSNLFLGSGLFDIERAVDARRPVRVGLATDLGAGTNFSQLVSMNEAYKVAQLNGFALSAHQAFYLATLGAARALYLDDCIGRIAPGMEADLTVLDLHATPVLEYRLRYAQDLDELLFVLMTLGDDRLACATYVAGERVMSRDREGPRDWFCEPLAR